MGKRYKHLFAKVVSHDNLWLSYLKAARGKRDTIGYLQFRQNEAANIARLGWLLRRRSVAAAKRKIARYRRAGDTQALENFIASWRGHAQWANTHNLLNRLGVSA